MGSICASSRRSYLHRRDPVPLERADPDAAVGVHLHVVLAERLARVVHELDLEVIREVGGDVVELDREPLGQRLGQDDVEGPVGFGPKRPSVLPLDDLHRAVAELQPAREITDAVAGEVVVEERAIAGDEVVIGPHAVAGCSSSGARGRRGRSRRGGRLGGGRKRLAIAVHDDHLFPVLLRLPDAGVVADHTGHGIVAGLEHVRHRAVRALGGLALGGPFGPALGGVFDFVPELRLRGRGAEQEGKGGEYERKAGTHGGKLIKDSEVERAIVLVLYSCHEMRRPNGSAFLRPRAHFSTVLAAAVTRL